MASAASSLLQGPLPSGARAARLLARGGAPRCESPGLGAGRAPPGGRGPCSAARSPRSRYGGERRERMGGGEREWKR